MEIYTYVVEGRGEFPSAVMRSEDSIFYSLHHKTLAETVDQRRRVKLETGIRDRFWAPLVEQWNSFGWTVVEFNGMPVLPQARQSVQVSPEYTEAFDAMVRACKEAAHSYATPPTPGERRVSISISALKAIESAIAKAEGSR
jgi:hypothetical protein